MRFQLAPMVWHNDKGMKVINPLIPMVNGGGHHFRYMRVMQVVRAGPSAVQQTIHRQECLFRGN